MEGTSSSSSSENNILLVDEFYFSALHDDDEVFPISDEKDAQELQLQEALMSSAIASLTPHITTQPPKIGDDDVEPLMKENDVPLMKKLKGKEKETGQSSEGFCGICMDVKSTGEMFRTGGCSHTFCTDCIGRYAGTKIQENISMVKCPDVKCKGELEPQSWKSIIPKEVFDRWENALCESIILGSQKFYCPFKDCSAMLVDDGEEVVTVSECSHCRRLFCAQCKVAWHAGIELAKKRRKISWCWSLLRRINGEGVLLASSLWKRMRAAYTLHAGVDTNFAMVAANIGATILVIHVHYQLET